jgi:hypothetical protein
MLTLLLKNTSSSNTILLVFIVFEAWVAESLGRGILPRYYYEFVSVFDTCSMYGSSLWPVNRMIMVGASAVLWGIVELIILKRKRNLI